MGAGALSFGKRRIAREIESQPLELEDEVRPSEPPEPPAFRLAHILLILSVMVVLAAGGAWLLQKHAPQATAAPSDTPPLSDADLDAKASVITSVPGTTIDYYEVHGRDVASIRATMDAQDTFDVHDHTPHAAVTHWYVNWHWPAAVGGGCDLAHVRLTYSATVRLPRLVDTASVDPEVLKMWDRFMLALMTHEAGHVRHAYEHMGEVAAAIRASTCATANADGQAAIDRLGQYDADYDRDTGHGATQGANFPN